MIGRLCDQAIFGVDEICQLIGLFELSFLKKGFLAASILFTALILLAELVLGLLCLRLCFWLAKSTVCLLLRSRFNWISRFLSGDERAGFLQILAVVQLVFLVAQGLNQRLRVEVQGFL